MQVHRRTETKRTRMNIAVDQRHPWYASEVFGFLLPVIPISLHLMISILKLISPDNSTSWLVIHDFPMPSILDLIPLALHDSPCGEPYWVCIRIIACLFLRSSFLPSSASHGVWMSVFFFFFFFRAFLLDLSDLPLELVRVWPFYLFFFWFILVPARVDLLQQWLCLIELIRQLNYHLFHFHLFFRL